MPPATSQKKKTKKKGRKGPPPKISPPIREWFYPLVMVYDELKGDEAARRKEKKRMMKKFRESATLSDPLDPVHNDFFPVEMTKDELYKVSAIQRAVFARD